MESFVDGFLFFFGLSDNPIEKYRKQLSQKFKEGDRELSGWEIDARNLYGDWQRVGMDIQKAYEKETTTTNR